LYSSSSIAFFLPCFHNLLLSCSDDEEPPTYATAAPPISPAATDEPAKPDVAPRTTRSSVKKVPQAQARNLKHAKKAKETDVSLEAHASTVSSDDVSNIFFTCFPFIHSYSYTLLFSGFIEEIYRLGHGMRGVPKGCESF
jgi:hypothetical protein